MRHCWRLRSQVSLSYRCKTRDRACFRKTFISLLHVSIGRNRPCAYLCRLSRHFARSSSQQSLLGRRAASSPGMHQECSICSHSLPPRQVHGELLPLGPVDAELLPQLCRLCCSAWQEQIQSTQDHLASFRLDEQRQRPGAKLSHPQVQSQLRGWRETISPAEPGKKNFLGCLLLGGWKRHLSSSEWLGLWESSLSAVNPSSQGVSLYRRLCAQPRCPCPASPSSL